MKKGAFKLLCTLRNRSNIWKWSIWIICMSHSAIVANYIVTTCNTLFIHKWKMKREDQITFKKISTGFLATWLHHLMLSILFDVWKMVFKFDLDIEFWIATIFFCFQAFWLILSNKSVSKMFFSFEKYFWEQRPETRCCLCVWWFTVFPLSPIVYLFSIALFLTFLRKSP